MNEILEKYFFSKHKSEEIGFYFLERNQILSEPKDFVGWLTTECENVQNQVWNRKFDINKNTILQDILLIIVDLNLSKIIGFISASKFRCDDETVGIYFSDGMILSSYRNKGLSNLSNAIINMKVFQQNECKITVYNLMVTGYIFAFKFFEENDFFIKSSHKKDDLPDFVIKKLSDDYHIGTLENNLIIRGAWNPQKNDMKDVWPIDVSNRYGFPADVNYFNGDVLVGLYILPVKYYPKLSDFINLGIKN
ncbi:MAG: hypothetical protein HQK54_09665 [Oligoflexales bacterium]|nr:hypothetical protein [Oligoflexales bacterium]